MPGGETKWACPVADCAHEMRQGSAGRRAHILRRHPSLCLLPCARPGGACSHGCKACVPDCVLRDGVAPRLSTVRSVKRFRPLDVAVRVSPALKKARPSQPPQRAEEAVVTRPPLDGPALLKKYQRTQKMTDNRRNMNAFYVEEYIAHLASNCYSKQRRDWEIPHDFKYVILSYRKAKVLRKNAWAYLKDCGIPDERIMIVVQNEVDWLSYSAIFPAASLRRIETRGYREAFNRVFVGPEPLVRKNEVVVQLDDDVKALCTCGGEGLLHRGNNVDILVLDEFLTRMMRQMEIARCNLAGFAPTAGCHEWIVAKHVLHSASDLSLQFIIGSARIIRNQLLSLDMKIGKSDFECTFEYFNHDGGVVRVPEQVRAQRYKGGTAVDSEVNEAKAMLEKYPTLVKAVVGHSQNATCSLKLYRHQNAEAMLTKVETEILPRRLGARAAAALIRDVRARLPLQEPTSRDEKRDLYFYLQEQRLGPGWDGPGKVRSRTLPGDLDTPSGQQKLAALRVAMAKRSEQMKAVVAKRASRTAARKAEDNECRGVKAARVDECLILAGG